jgi:hypothetical protein
VGQSAKEASEPDGQPQLNPRIRSSLRLGGMATGRRQFLLSTTRHNGHQNDRFSKGRPLEIFVNCAGSVAFACLVTWGKVPTELISFSRRKR